VGALECCLIRCAYPRDTCTRCIDGPSELNGGQCAAGERRERATHRSDVRPRGSRVARRGAAADVYILPGGWAHV
jgi:hypothetical protein